MTINWIKCSERMPEFEKEVLLACKISDGSCYFEIGARWSGNSAYHEYWNIDDRFGDVPIEMYTHWAELEPPE